MKKCLLEQIRFCANGHYLWFVLFVFVQQLFAFLKDIINPDFVASVFELLEVSRTVIRNSIFVLIVIDHLVLPQSSFVEVVNHFK
jgi:hypothetical protein